MDRPHSHLGELQQAARQLGFAMSCDETTGRLLATLAASKPAGRILELGTGVGAGTCWLQRGMDRDAWLTTIDIDGKLQSAAQAVLGEFQISYVVGDAGHWLSTYAGESFDLVFADTWPGKLTNLDAALDLVAPGGIYLVDDMNELPSWPAEHAAAIADVTRTLSTNPGFRCTRINDGSGLVIAVKASG